MKKRTVALLFAGGLALGLLVGSALGLIPAYRYWAAWDKEAPAKWKEQFSVDAPAPALVEGSSSDEQVIRSLREEMFEGWNSGDAGAFAAPFSENADFIAFDGTHIQGRDAIENMHDPLFKTHLKNTKLVGEVIGFRFIEPGKTALMHTRSGTIMAGEEEASAERDSIQTFVAAFQDGEWQLIAFHNNRIRPMGRDAAGTIIWLLSDLLWSRFGP